MSLVTRVMSNEAWILDGTTMVKGLKRGRGRAADADT